MAGCELPELSSLLFRISQSWPIRIKILGEVFAAFLYPERCCHIEVVADFHLRTKPVIVKTIYLEIKGLTHKQMAQSFQEQEGYIRLSNDIKRKEEFIYDDFQGGKEGRLIVKADDYWCRTQWFPIKLTNKKDDLLPLKGGTN